MSTVSIIPYADKGFWQKYVTTAQYEAGQFFNAPVAKTVYQKAVEERVISGQYRPTVLNYTDNSWSWRTLNTTNTTVVNSPKSAKRPQPVGNKTPLSEQEKEQKRAQRAKVAGPIFAAGGAFLVGYFYKEYSRQNATMQYVIEVQKSIPLMNSFGNLGNLSRLQEVLTQLIDNQVKIDKLNSSKINSRLYSSIGVLAGGSALAVGGFRVISWLMTAGQVTLVVSTLFALYHIGRHWNDHKELHKYYTAIAGNPNSMTNGLADEALLLLATLPDDIRDTPDTRLPPPPYEPLHPSLYNAGWAEPSAPPYEEEASL